MKSYILSPLAEQDLFDIWSYIAVDSTEAADAVLSRFRKELRKLEANPNIGHRRADFPSHDLRSWLVYSYLIVYRIVGDELQVVRIIHGSRDIPALL